MSSYAASARIGAVRPHLRALDISADSTDEDLFGGGMPAASWSEVSASHGGPMDTQLPRAVASPVIDPIDDDLSSWLERVSIGWGQLTWYLFNPEGWR
jgi:hypothetical protein